MKQPLAILSRKCGRTAECKMLSTQQLMRVSHSSRGETVIPIPSTTCLLSFECVAKHGSISRAAAELNLTQSAVSRQILQLEAMLDVALFDRVRQRLVITAAGKLYLKDIHRLIADLKDSTNRIMACGSNTSLLNLAVLPTFATQWLIPRLPGFLKKVPDATVNFSTRISAFDFGVEPFDAAIHYGSPDWPGAVAYHLMHEDTIPVCSRKYQEAVRIRKPSDLAQAVLLHQSTRADAWSEWFEAMNIDQTHPRRGPHLELFGMIAQAAVHGLGVALLPRMLIEDELSSGKLVELFSCSIRSAHSYFLVVPENKATTQLTAAFTRWIVREAKLSQPDYSLNS